MATPAEITEGAKCFWCVPNQMDALLYLFATIAGVPDPATIAANSACYACVPDKWSALLYLADTIATNGSSSAAGDIVTCADVDPVAPPSGDCAIWINRASQAVFYWDSVLAQWVLKV